MAELKSITGDEPYTGVGNAPAPIPRPMGFWGRPRLVFNDINQSSLFLLAIAAIRACFVLSRIILNSIIPKLDFMQINCAIGAWLVREQLTSHCIFILMSLNGNLLDTLQWVMEELTWVTLVMVAMAVMVVEE
ncbi:unnamed protein product [Strongylus vulgaris]|uniref:Uncharacterized protein n=1 Tax=Strongylus vulgaris TaxID=40348 RepID=A0A3P7J1K0_STRVU|nr:unnamed protein product [Strongylus vulgaris]